jgi:hypothetical protein
MTSHCAEQQKCMFCLIEILGLSRIQAPKSQKNCALQYILIADEEFRVGEPTQAEGVDIRSMTEAAGAAQPAGSLQVR